MLKKILSLLGIIVFLSFVIAGGALLTGVITVGDPEKAAEQLLSGDVRQPGVGIEGMGIGTEDTSDDEVSEMGEGDVRVETEFTVNNTNHIGGKVDEIRYDVYVSDDHNDGYEFVGEGVITDLKIPPNATVNRTNSFEVESEDVQMGTELESAGTRLGDGYMRVDGVATFDMDFVSFSVEFVETREMVRG